MAEINDKSTGRMVILNFANDNAPVVKEYSGKDYIQFGEKNDYSDFIINLYNRSAKHNAIINGKVNYIMGNGLGKALPAPGFVDCKDATGAIIGAIPVNCAGETMDEVMKKCALDVEIHGGFRMFVVWNKTGGCELYHVEFQKIKTGKEPGTYYFKQSWATYKKDDVTKPYVEFNPNNRRGCQVFAYNEYRPGCDKYPLPGYTGAIDYIQADIEVGAHTYGNAAGGFTASKMISYFNGDPGEEGARIIERQLTNKFTGRKGKKFVLSFQTDSSKKPQVDDLGASDLTKEDFTAIDGMIEQNIFAGHSITSPALFGIKTAGQLGGNQELYTAYSIFTNTYAKPKQKDYTRVINFFGELMGMGNDYFIQPLDPIGLQIDIKNVINAMPKEFVFDYFNVPKEMRNLPNIGGHVPDSPAKTSS